MRLFPASSLSVQLSVLKNCKSSSCKHPVTPCGSFTAGTARTAIHGLVMPQRTSCALPRRLVIGRMPNNCTIYYRRTSHLCDTEEAPGNIARKNAYKETSIGIKIPLGAICSLECVLWNKSYRQVRRAKPPDTIY